MAASFELMDSDSGNLVGSYLTLDDALRIVRAAWAQYGAPGAQGLLLIAVHDDESQHLVAADDDLARLALREEIVQST